MSVRHRLFMLALMMGGGSLCATAEVSAEESQIAVIVSDQDSHAPINGNLLREIYLKRVFVNGDGHQYIPLNLPPTHHLRDAFLLAALHMDAAQLQSYWDRRYFEGVSPPYVLGSQAAVVKFVAMTPGAVGYVQRCYVTTAVHIVLIMPLPETARVDQCPNGADR